MDVQEEEEEAHLFLKSIQLSKRNEWNFSASKKTKKLNTNGSICSFETFRIGLTASKFILWGI